MQAILVAELIRRGLTVLVTNPAIVAAAPEIMLASWCGQSVDWQQVRSRPGWAGIPCVQTNQLYEIPGSQILQPGFGLVAGYQQIKEIVRQAADRPAISGNETR